MAPLKILCVTDLHGETKALDCLRQYLQQKKPGLVLCAGDITQFGSAAFVAEFTSAIPVPFFAVAGNCDTPETESLLGKHSLHLRKQSFRDYDFVGFQGSLPTPVKTIIEYPEKTFEQLRGLVNNKTILLAHQPPFNTKCDMVGNGRHVGSRNLRKIIEEKKPLACICGHIHESRAIDRIGATIIINPGQLREGFAATLELPALKAELLNL